MAKIINKRLSEIIWGTTIVGLGFVSLNMYNPRYASWFWTAKVQRL